jgi:hypothetical protein
MTLVAACPIEQNDDTYEDSVDDREYIEESKGTRERGRGAYSTQSVVNLRYS